MNRLPLILLAVATTSFVSRMDAQSDRAAVAARGAGCSSSVTAWWAQTVGSGKHGRIACARDAARPVIMLVHGSYPDARTWSEPSYTESAYDYKREPGRRRIGANHEEGNNGLYEITRSDWLYGKNRRSWDQRNSWFQFLAGQGYTVATWTQDGITVADAMQSTRAAFDSLLAQTAARSPRTPPPVALVGHGRGGLLIRQLLKEKGSMGRVKWVITLHSPHTGTEVARVPQKTASEVSDVVACCTPAFITGPAKQRLTQLAIESIRPLTQPLIADESRELAPDSPLYRNLVQGEKKLEDVTYYTFGGTNPRVSRLYAWLFDVGSAEPQYTDANEQYFVWWVKPVEVAGVSPLLETIRDFAPEVSPGTGDGLVSDARSKLPWSIHATTGLNHAEVLWNVPLMQRVDGLIGRSPARMNPTRRDR